MYVLLGATKSLGTRFRPFVKDSQKDLNKTISKYGELKKGDLVFFIESL